ncbi:MAG: ABC transporter substrate-binding protein [Candidatus Dormibacteria bacterium]|jgi:peptide/nickel transport system substrate-binding protein
MNRRVGATKRKMILLCGLLALVATAASPALASAKSSAKSGGVATFALPPAETSSYIFPLQSLSGAGPVDDNEFQMLMYLPLYWFGKDGTDVVNYQRSLATAPQYSNGGKTVTIHLKSWQWSDGVPVTSRDVEFWMNELIANKEDYYGYVPGEFPDNVVSQSYPNASTVVLTFNQKYNPLWILNNELSQITPIPQQSWDKTSATGAIGDYDTTPAGAVAVYNYLNAESTTISTYQTNPLWQVVDGAWRLKKFDSTTQFTELVPNKAYSGLPKPTLSALEEVPFTSGAAELNALRGGQLDYGYLPPSEYSQVNYFKRRGYQVVPWPLWATAYAVYNFSNPTAGPIFKQLYVRQAMQELMNQPQDVKDVWHGYAVPTYGPVPITPSNPYISPSEKNSSYKFSVASASKLLSEHGWKTGSSGVATCQRAGTASDDCGAGIVQGAALSFKFLYTSGNTGFTDELESLQSSASRAGIKLTLTTEPFNSVEANAFSCNPSTGEGCSWDIDMWAGWSWDPDYLPTADEIFATGAGGNAGSYNNATADQLIAAETEQSGVEPVIKADEYFAHDLPVLWTPGFDYQLSVIKDTLHGTQPQDPVGNIYPDEWSLG